MSTPTETRQLVADLVALVDLMLPGVKSICFTEFGLLNETLIKARAHLRDEPAAPARKFSPGDPVRKKSGSAWSGRVVGWYSTDLTPEGYAVESDAHPGSVQIYPASALEPRHD